MRARARPLCAFSGRTAKFCDVGCALCAGRHVGPGAIRIGQRVCLDGRRSLHRRNPAAGRPHAFPLCLARFTGRVTKQILGQRTLGLYHRRRRLGGLRPRGAAGDGGGSVPSAPHRGGRRGRRRLRRALAGAAALVTLLQAPDRGARLPDDAPPLGLRDGGRARALNEGTPLGAVRGRARPAAHSVPRPRARRLLRSQLGQLHPRAPGRVRRVGAGGRRQGLGVVRPAAALLGARGGPVSRPAPARGRRRPAGGAARGGGGREGRPGLPSRPDPRPTRDLAALRRGSSQVARRRLGAWQRPRQGTPGRCPHRGGRAALAVGLQRAAQQQRAHSARPRRSRRDRGRARAARSRCEAHTPPRRRSSAAGTSPTRATSPPSLPACGWSAPSCAPRRRSRSR